MGNLKVVQRHPVLEGHGFVRALLVVLQTKVKVCICFKYTMKDPEDIYRSNVYIASYGNCWICFEGGVSMLASYQDHHCQYQEQFNWDHVQRLGNFVYATDAFIR